MSNLLTIIAIPVVIIMFLLICVALALLNKLSGSISMLLSLQGQDSAKYDQSIQSLFSQLDLQHSSISDIETNLMKAIESTKQEIQATNQEIIENGQRNAIRFMNTIKAINDMAKVMEKLVPLAELKPQIEAILETQAKAVAAKGYSLRNMFDKLISLREAAHIYMADLSDIMAKLDSPIASSERIELLKRYANLTRLFMKKADPENRYPHYIIYERPLSSVMRAKDDLRESFAEFGVNIHKAKQDPDPRTAAVEPKYSRHSKKSVDTPTPQPSESSRGVSD